MSNNGISQYNNNNNDVKVFIKSEQNLLTPVSNETDKSVPVSNANLTTKDFNNSSVGKKKKPITSNFQDSSDNKTKSPIGQKNQTSALLMANSTVDAVAVNSTTVAGAYPTIISNTNGSSINNTTDVLNGISPCNMLATPLDSNLNNFYSTPYASTGFTSEHLLGSNNSLPTTVASTIPLSYCWPSHSSHYNQMTGLHGLISCFSLS